MKNLFLITCISFILLACSSKELKAPPEGILKKDKMVSLLVDIHIAEGHLATLERHPDSLKLNARKHYKSVLHMHQIGEKTFWSSMEYYTQNPHILEELYDPILEELNAKEGKDWK